MLVEFLSVPAFSLCYAYWHNNDPVNMYGIHSKFQLLHDCYVLTRPVSYTYVHRNKWKPLQYLINNSPIFIVVVNFLFTRI